MIHSIPQRPSILYLEKPRLRKWESDSYYRVREAREADMEEYLALVEEFAKVHSVPLPSTCCVASVCAASSSCHFAFFLDFLEALVVRFKRLWCPSVVAFRCGAMQLMQQERFGRKKIAQFMHALDRSSLLCWKHVMRHCVPNGCLWSGRGALGGPECALRRVPCILVDPRDLISITIAACSLFSSAAAARHLHVCTHDHLQKYLEDFCEYDFKFAYPRALNSLRCNLSDIPV